MSDNDDSKRGLLDRGLAILDHLADAREASTADLSEAVGISRSAAYRLVDRLETLGYLEAASAGRWRLGPAVARLAMAAVQTTGVADVAPELLRVLVQQTRETASLAVLSGDEMVFVYRELGPQSVRVSPELGARRPLHATSIGKAFLAALPDSERAQLMRRVDLRQYTPHTLTTRAALDADLAQTRARGWSEENGEFDAASACCGAPIRDHTGRVIAAISVSGLSSRMDSAMGTVGPLVSATAGAISRRLGFHS